MNHSNHFLVTDELLWDYADGLLSSTEKQQLDTYLVQHPEHQERLKTIQRERMALHTFGPESPRAGFADKIMAAWVSEQMDHSAAAAQKDRKLLLFPLVLGFLLITAMASTLVIVVKVLSSGANLPKDQVPAIPTLSPSVLTEFVSNTTVQMAVFTSFTLLLLVFADRFWKSAMHNK